MQGGEPFCLLWSSFFISFVENSIRGGSALKQLKSSMFITGVSSLFILSACGDGSGGDDVGTITLYSPETPDMSAELAEAFEAEYGGTVNVEYAGTNVLVNQMLAESDNPQADVWYGGGGFMPFESAIDMGILEAYQPEAASDWEVYENDIKMRQEDWMYTGIELFALGFAYNPDLVSEDELPQTWEDLLDHAGKGSCKCRTQQHPEQRHSLY